MAPYLCKAQGSRVRLDKCSLVRGFASPMQTGVRNWKLDSDRGGRKTRSCVWWQLVAFSCHENMSLSATPKHSPWGSCKIYRLMHFRIPVLVRQWTRECEKSRCRREEAGRKRARVVTLQALTVFLFFCSFRKHVCISSHCLCFCSRLVFQAASAAGWKSCIYDFLWRGVPGGGEHIYIYLFLYIYIHSLLHATTCIYFGNLSRSHAGWDEMEFSSG